MTKTQDHATEWKDVVRSRFSRAAGSYDEYADVQLEAAEGLAERLGDADHREILEIGCGTGSYTARLLELFPAARVAAVDFAPGMLEEARRKHSDARIEWTLADGETYQPDDGRSFDLVTSNSALQWFEHPDRALDCYRRLMVPGGRLAFSSFGPETCGELREVLGSLGSSSRELPASGFVGGDALRAMLASRFTEVRVEERRFQRTYPTLWDFLRCVKFTGVNGRTSDRLTTAAGLRRMESAYRERFGEIRVTHQVFFVFAQAPTRGE
ncbi:MAG: methyltransferase domain-containing protein [Planctomycetales bacterium]